MCIQISQYPIECQNQISFIFCNNRMGILNSKSVKVATANYSGITNSPFEFYTIKQTDELQQLNNIFKQLFSQVSGAEAQLLKGQYSADNQAIMKNKSPLLDNQYEWGLSDIEKYIQKGRYCPQYRQDAGIQNGRLLDKERFDKRWDSEFTKNIKYLKNDKDIAENGKKLCKLFDFLIYKTFVQYSYRKMFEKYTQQEQKDLNITPEQKEIKLGDRDTDDSRSARLKRREALKIYESFLERYHKKPYLNHKLKFQFIKDLIYTHDVVFLQDCCSELINQIKNEGDFTIIEQQNEVDCYIVIRFNQKKFKHIYDINKFFSENQDFEGPFIKYKFDYSAKRTDMLSSKSIDFKEKTQPAYCFVDRLFLMSVHLKSKPEKKYYQLFMFMRHLLDINHRYNGKLQIIVGGDFNLDVRHFKNEKSFNPSQSKLSSSQLQQLVDLSVQFWSQFYLYPENESLEKCTITTHKKRTWLQSQAKKAEKVDESSRDYIISNFPLSNCKIIGSSSPNDLLPTEKHPFDHFFISAKIPILDSPQSTS